MATASDVHQLQDHGGGVRVELDKVDRLLCQAKTIDTYQVLGLTQALGPHLDLPHFFKCRTRIRNSVVSCSSSVG